jgi:hypothetical protein
LEYDIKEENTNHEDNVTMKTEEDGLVEDKGEV